jgi:hypothetical protein
MAIAQAYPLGAPKANDLVIGTSIPAANTNEDPKTVNFSVGDLASYIVSNYPGSPISGQGTFNTIPLWTPDGKTLGDSIITQAASGQGVTVTGQLDVAADFKVSGSTVLNGSLTANGVSQFNAEVRDKIGQPGSLGQVLSSTGTNVEWVDASEGTVSGPGTSPFLPYWLDDKTLGDSPISWFPINTPRPKLDIDTNVAISGITTFGDDIIVGEALLAPDSTTPNSYIPGTPGQVLTSTGTKTEWVDPTDVVSGSVATLIPYLTTATPGGSETYTALNNIVKIGWSGINGIYVINLPSATTIPYRVIRFITNGSYPGGGAYKVRFTPPAPETIDGAAFFEISKVYEGVSIWSTGTEWVVIQAKAH